MVKKKSETKVCKHCQTEIPHSAKICPNCKKRVKGGKVKWIALIAVVLIAVILMLNSGNNYNDGSDYDEMNLVAEAEYPKLFSDIGAYRDRSVDLYGKVFNVLDSEDGVVFQIYVDSDYHNSVMVYYSRDFSVKEDEYVLVKGVVTDTYEGENLLGGTVVCPLVSASIVEQSSYIDAFSRTLKVVETSNAEWSKDRLTVKIDKVEFAKNETRLYVTASNEGEKTASVYSYSSVLIQNGK